MCRQLAAELGVGTHLLDDILDVALPARRSIRATACRRPVFRRGIMKLEDLSAGMELSGTVLNVVDFGVFVDIGLSDSGLVHISRLADRFIRDPHEVVGVGDVLKVWVVDVDKTRRRVSLTAIAPGSERPHRPPRERQPRDSSGHRGQPRQQQAVARHSSRAQPKRPVGAAPPQAAPAGRVSVRRGHDGGGGGGGGGRRDQRRGGRPQAVASQDDRAPADQAQEGQADHQGPGRRQEPMRSFSDLVQLFDKKKQKPQARTSRRRRPPASSLCSRRQMRRRVGVLSRSSRLTGRAIAAVRLNRFCRLADYVG